MHISDRPVPGPLLRHLPHADQPLRKSSNRVQTDNFRFTKCLHDFDISFTLAVFTLTLSSYIVSTNCFFLLQAFSVCLSNVNFFAPMNSLSMLNSFYTITMMIGNPITELHASAFRRLQSLLILGKFILYEQSIHTDTLYSTYYDFRFFTKLI